MTRQLTDAERLDRMRRLPDGELVREAARWCDDKPPLGPMYGTLLRELAKRLKLPCTGDNLDSHGRVKP